MEPPQAHGCAISKVFSDTLSEMAPNISDIEQKIRTMSEKCPKKKKKITGGNRINKKFSVEPFRNMQPGQPVARNLLPRSRNRPSKSSQKIKPGPSVFFHET